MKPIRQVLIVVLGVYTVLRTLEVYGEKANKNSVMILTTDSDFYRYVKQAIPQSKQSLPALEPPRAAAQ